MLVDIINLIIYLYMTENKTKTFNPKPGAFEIVLDAWEKALPSYIQNGIIEICGKDDRGNSYIFPYAFTNDSTKFSSALKKYNCPLDEITDKDGDTLLSAAVRGGPNDDTNASMAKAILDYSKEKYGSGYTKYYIAITNKDGETALERLVTGCKLTHGCDTSLRVDQHFETVELLNDKGANYKTPFSGHRSQSKLPLECMLQTYSNNFQNKSSVSPKLWDTYYNGTVKMIGNAIANGAETKGAVQTQTEHTEHTNCDCSWHMRCDDSAILSLPVEIQKVLECDFGKNSPPQESSQEDAVIPGAAGTDKVIDEL